MYINFTLNVQGAYIKLHLRSFFFNPFNRETDGRAARWGLLLGGIWIDAPVARAPSFSKKKIKKK